MIRKHWFLLILMLVAAWYVVHKNCGGCQARLQSLKSKFAG